MNFEFPQFNKSETEKKTPEKWSPTENERLFVKRSDGRIEDDWAVSQINNGIAIVCKPDPDKPNHEIIKRIPVSDLEKINNKNNIDFLQAENMDDLYKLIRSQDSLKGSSEEYSPETLIKTIEEVKNGKMGLNMVTRANDLRLAVKKILENSPREN